MTETIRDYVYLLFNYTNMFIGIIYIWQLPEIYLFFYTYN